MHQPPRVRALRNALLVATSLSLIEACAASDASSETSPSAGPAEPNSATPSTTDTTTIATSTAGALEVSTVTAPSTTTGTTTASTSTAESTTTTTTTAPPIVFEDAASISSVAVFGDSLVADLTAIGGRNNQVVPQLTELLVGDTELSIERVENLALPGQSVVSDLGLIATDDATIRPYVEQTLSAQPELVDLAVVAISSSDINLNASLPEPLPTAALADDMLVELEAVNGLFRAAGVDVAFLPIFGINNDVFSDLRCALQPACPVGPDAEIEAINSILWDSDLPMLFERFEGLDQDGDGRTDRVWFDDVDARFPDDGVHPNAGGQELLSTTVFEALRPLLS